MADDNIRCIWIIVVNELDQAGLNLSELSAESGARGQLLFIQSLPTKKISSSDQRKLFEAATRYLLAVRIYKEVTFNLIRELQRTNSWRENSDPFLITAFTSVTSWSYLLQTFNALSCFGVNKNLECDLKNRLGMVFYKLNKFIATDDELLALLQKPFKGIAKFRLLNKKLVKQDNEQIYAVARPLVQIQDTVLTDKPGNLLFVRNVSFPTLLLQIRNYLNFYQDDLKSVDQDSFGLKNDFCLDIPRLAERLQKRILKSPLRSECGEYAKQIWVDELINQGALYRFNYVHVYSAIRLSTKSQLLPKSIKIFDRLRFIDMVKTFKSIKAYSDLEATDDNSYSKGMMEELYDLDGVNQLLGGKQ